MMSASVVRSSWASCAGEGPLVPEPVAVAQPLELVGDDALEQRSDRAAAATWSLGQRADPQVDVVDGAVECLERLPARPRRSDLREAR